MCVCLHLPCPKQDNTTPTAPPGGGWPITTPVREADPVLLLSVPPTTLQPVLHLVSAWHRPHGCALMSFALLVPAAGWGDCCLLRLLSWAQPTGVLACRSRSRWAFHDMHLLCSLNIMPWDHRVLTTILRGQNVAGPQKQRGRGSTLSEHFPVIRARVDWLESTGR